jgi:hypothetical protein
MPMELLQGDGSEVRRELARRGLGIAPGRQCRELLAAYLLANGQGKARAARNGTVRAPQRWRVLFLSAGEESLAGLMARAGKQPTAGQEIRLADIEADAGQGLGLFDVLHIERTPAARGYVIHARR